MVQETTGDISAMVKYKSHPYAIYVKNANVQGRNKIGAYSANNFGFSGPCDTRLEKTKIRVMCIGGSTTELTHGDDINNSYPGWLAKMLGDGYEVLNAGCCGYTTAEMLVNYALRLVDFKPDYLVIYEAINDVLYAGMLEGFVSDYTHNRVNVGITPTAKCITACINKQPMIAAKEYPDEAVDTFRRNIRNICSIAKANKTRPMIVKFNFNPNIMDAKRVYPLYELGLNGSEDVFRDGLLKNIEALEEVAGETGTPFIYTEQMTADDFIDSCHFNSGGMRKMAKAVSEYIGASN